MSPAAEAALRHVRKVQGWSDVRIPEVRREPAGTSLAVVRVRDRETGVLWRYGVRVGRGGEVLDDAVLLHDRPDDRETFIAKGRSR